MDEEKDVRITTSPSFFGWFLQKLEFRKIQILT